MKKIYLVFYLLFIAFLSGFSSPLQKQVELLMQDSASGMSAVTSVLFTYGTSPNYFSSEDIALAPDTTGNPQLYSYSLNNVACTFNSYGTLNNTVVLSLGATLVTAGTYTFSMQQFTNFDPASMVFLEDRQLNIFTDLRQSPYKVALGQTGQISGRFYLHITYPPVATAGASGCSNNDGVINVVEDNSVIWNAVKVYDSLSVLVAIDTNISGSFSFTGLAGGNYRVEFDYGLYAPIQYVQIQEHQLVTVLSIPTDHGTVGHNMQFYATNSNADQFQWDFGDGSTITGVANPVYAYYIPGTYTVVVNSSNVYGCTAHSDTTVYIDYATSVDEIDGNAVRIITDSKSVRIDIDNVVGGKYEFNVYSISGQVIKTGRISSSDMVLDFAAEATGVYIVSIKSTTSSLSKKVIITH